MQGEKCDCQSNWLWPRFSIEEMIFFIKFIFKFFWSGVEVKRDVELRNATRNLSRIWQKESNTVHTAMCGIQREADLCLMYLKQF